MVIQKLELTDKIEASVKPEIKALLQEAADLQGRSLDDFILSTVQAEAKRVIEQYRILKLSKEDAEAFAEEVLNPSPPNPVLKEAAEWYEQAMAD